jgi:SAM-dependent methyltransferase
MRAGEGGWRRLQDELIQSYSAPEVVARYRDRMTAGLRQWETTLLDRVHGTPGSVLVVGCGTGREAFALEDRGWTVVGIDVTPALLDVAREEAARRSSSIDLRLGDGRRLPCDDGSVGAATLWSQVLNNVPTRAGRTELLREVTRTLEPGGAVSFSVHDRARTLPLLDAGQIVTVDEPEPGDLLLLEREGGVRRPNHYFDEPELRSLCADVGLDTPQLWHSSDLGEAFDNLFVVAATKPA